MIKFDKRNYRKHSDRNKQLISKSLSETGAGRSIVIDADNEIIGGNGIFEAWGNKPVKIIESDGNELIVVKRTDLKTDDPKRKQMAVMDNSTSDSSEFDMELLQCDFEAFELEDMGIVLPMEDEVLEAQEDDYEIPDTIETDIVLGDIFTFEKEQKELHRLLCGDSTDSDSVAKLMNGEKADMVFTDPPYNVDYVGKTKDKLKIQNDKHNVSEFRKIISDAISNLILFTKRGGAYYVCIPLEVGVTDLFLERTHLQSVLIWLKNTIVMGRKDYQQQTEPILFLLNDTEEETYEGIVYGWNFGDSHEFYGGRKQSNVWKFDKPQRNGKHPTMKPIPLVGKAINNSSKEKDLTLDLFLGSGSTMVAAHQLNRKCYGMELDPKYCQVIIDRMRKLDPTLTIKKNGELI